MRCSNSGLPKELGKPQPRELNYVTAERNDNGFYPLAATNVFLQSNKLIDQLKTLLDLATTRSSGFQQGRR